MSSWSDLQTEIARLAAVQLFFVGGAPRSGTTWLQQILDCHPDVCCRGEGLFGAQLRDPLYAMMTQRRQAIEAKNRVFQHTGGYPQPEPEDAAFLLGTAILLALRRQVAGQAFRAVGEKTPENVFIFPELKQLFPTAKFIGIARDPRDVLASSWNFFQSRRVNDSDGSAKEAFIRRAMPSLATGARTMIALAERYPQDCITVTYEELHQNAAPTVARLFRFLGVSDRSDIVAACLARTDFAVQTAGRPLGQEIKGSFHWQGVVGGWRTTLTPEMNQHVLHDLGWMFPHFGWVP